MHSLEFILKSLWAKWLPFQGSSDCSGHWQAGANNNGLITHLTNWDNQHPCLSRPHPPLSSGSAHFNSQLPKTAQDLKGSVYRIWEICTFLWIWEIQKMPVQAPPPSFFRICPIQLSVAKGCLCNARACPVSERYSLHKIMIWDIHFGGFDKYNPNACAGPLLSGPAQLSFPAQSCLCLQKTWFVSVWKQNSKSSLVWCLVKVW